MILSPGYTKQGRNSASVAKWSKALSRLSLHRVVYKSSPSHKFPHIGTNIVGKGVSFCVVLLTNLSGYCLGITYIQAAILRFQALTKLGSHPRDSSFITSQIWPKKKKCEFFGKVEACRYGGFVKNMVFTTIRTSKSEVFTREKNDANEGP